MKTDTQQLRRAQEELSRQRQKVKQIQMQTEVIQKEIRSFETLEKLSYQLKNWSEKVEDIQRSMLQMTLALENIARLYEENENRIVEECGYSSLRMPVFRIDQVQRQRLHQIVGEKYSHILREFGGEEIENRD